LSWRKNQKKKSKKINFRRVHHLDLFSIGIQEEEEEEEEEEGEREKEEGDQTSRFCQSRD
jgi:hypothetical protein